MSFISDLSNDAVYNMMIFIFYGMFQFVRKMTIARKLMCALRYILIDFLCDHVEDIVSYSFQRSSDNIQVK